MIRPLATSTLPRGVRSNRGFTLIELMIGLVIFALMAGTVITVLVTTSKQKTSTANEVGSTQMARLSLQMLSRDLRAAGFGTDITNATPQKSIAYIDSMQVLINANMTPFPDTSQVKLGYPLAYNPAGAAKPKPLNGTSWAPPSRYRSGAETIRWTMDLNNDGLVNAADMADDDARDARRTPNPNDYELVREVWGDSTGGVTGSNGPTRDRVGLVKKPGGGTPALFTVYLAGQAAPWDWSSGPVPANRLAEIDRIEVNIVATSPTKGMLQSYSDVRLSTSVSELRNSPNFKWIYYNVNGYVFKDVNKNGVKDAPDVALAGMSLSLGGYLSAVTGPTGFYTFSVPPGTYVLKHEPPANYGILTQPDSFVVTVGPDIQKDFADTLRAGGWLNLTVYNDVDANHSYGGSDKPMVDHPVTLLADDSIVNTDVSGLAQFFLPVGTFQVSAELPDSFFFSTPNPLSVTMTNGATKTGSIGMYLKDYGLVNGTVFSDLDGDQVLDTGEKGIKDARVSVILPDSTELWTTSTNNGGYNLKLPVNDPPHTTAYTVVCTPPDGYSGFGTLQKTGVFVKSKQTISGQNFAMSKFTVWQHDIDDKITAITTADMIERDWKGTQANHHRLDSDLILGSTRTERSEIQEWFNQYDDNPPFHALKSAEGTAPQSVLAVACDTIDAKSSDGFCRPDVIVGTRYCPTSNWGIWFTQDGTGNEGYLGASQAQSYTTNDKGDVQVIKTLPGGAGNAPNILVGTRSPAFGTGTIEVWTSASHASPSYTRSQLLPPAGSIPGNNLGEVTCIEFGDLNKDGKDEMVVGTLTGFYSGQIMVFTNNSGTWTYQWKATLNADAVMALAVTDVNDDGKKDIVVGTQTGLTSGNLIYYKSKAGATTWVFDPPVTAAAQGVVTSMGHVDFNGDAIDDLIVGWRDSDLTYKGGVDIWYTTGKNLPASGSDVTDNKVKKWVDLVLIGDFNYGMWPQPPKDGPVPDIIVVVRRDNNHSTLFEMIR
jgi:prepilin-type N-terminal cleavage/methylation domain-containing protein